MLRRLSMLLVACLAIVVPISPAAASGQEGFVTRQGTQLKLDGKPFKFYGSNNYYLMYQSRAMADDVFADAQAAGFSVLRTWAWLDIGNQDGSNSVAGKANGVYLQYWDPVANAPAYNDGPDGLERLDYVLYRARQSGIKLVLAFTNNWSDFGGMDQYVRWAGMVRDAAGRRSNVADLQVTVKPDPTAAILIESWESGVDGWAPGSWQTNAGTVAQTADFHTDGAYGLHIAAADGGWFGFTPAAPLNIAGKATLKYDIRAGAAAGTGTTVALQVGAGWAWCQGPWTWVPAGTSTTIEIDLVNGVSCDQTALGEVHGVLIYVSSGDYDLDNVRAE